jgi:CubicO group peptidase (beta-lactamase class C family)
MRIATIVAVWVLACACGGSKVRYEGIARAIARGDVPKTTSVLVMHGSKLEYERYFGDATADTLHDTRSTTKSLTALAVGIAIDRHAVSGLSASGFGYLADLAPFAHDEPDKAAITIEDLLTMSSALDCNDDDDDSPGNEEKMYPKQVWVRWAADLPVRADYQRDGSGRGPWHYCTAGAFLLGQIVQRAAHQPIDQFMAEHLFAPLGITKWEFSKSPSGEIMTGGGLRLRTRDLATVARMVLADGAHGGKQVIPAAFARAALTVHREAMPDAHYGYLIWKRQYTTPCGKTIGWAMAGNGGNTVVMFGDLDAVVVVTRTNYNMRGMHQQTIALIEEQILPELACKR